MVAPGGAGGAGRVHGANSGGSPGDWYNALPPITRLYGTICVCTTIGAQFGLVDLRYIFLSWDLIVRKFQVWRLITPFFFIGKLGLPFMFRLYFLIVYGCQLEKGTYEHRTADYTWMYMCSCAFMLVFSLQPFIPLYFFGSPFVFSLLYLWSRFYPDQQVSIYGVVPLKAFWLPWAFMVITTLMGGNPMEELLGILTGHFYYFMTDLYPRAGGTDWLRTPKFVGEFLAWAKLSGVAVDRASQDRLRQRQQQWGAFRGTARRLND